MGTRKLVNILPGGSKNQVYTYICYWQYYQEVHKPRVWEIGLLYYLMGHMTNASFKQGVEIFRMPKIDNCSPWLLENSCESIIIETCVKRCQIQIVVICVIVTRDVLKILERKSFLTRMLQNFVLIEPGMVMSHPSDVYFSGQPSGNLDHSVAHWFLKFAVNSG